MMDDRVGFAAVSVLEGLLLDGLRVEYDLDAAVLYDRCRWYALGVLLDY